MDTMTDFPVDSFSLVPSHLHLFFMLDPDQNRFGVFCHYEGQSLETPFDRISSSDLRSLGLSSYLRQ